MAAADPMRQLHSELLAYSQGQLLRVDELWQTLERQLEDVAKLLDKKTKNDTSRSKITQAKQHEVQGVTYSLPDEVKQNAFRLADMVNLDEEEAANRLVLDQETAVSIGVPPLEYSINQFHEEQYFRLDSLRLILRSSIADDDQPPERLEDQARFEDYSARLFDIRKKKGSGTGTFFKVCLDLTAEMRKKLASIQEKLQSASILGSSMSQLESRSLSQQSSDILAQHEVLGSVLVLLARLNSASSDDFITLLKLVQSMEKYDSILLHLLPATCELCLLYGPPNREITRSVVDKINDEIFNERHAASWAQNQVLAMIQLVWLSVYAPWIYDDEPKADSGNWQRARNDLFDRFFKCLKSNALDQLLAVIADAQDPTWPDPARSGLRGWLQRHPPVSNGDISVVSEPFRSIVRDVVERVMDSIIDSQPDELRHLRSTEEQQYHQVNPDDRQYDLERFLLIMAYCFATRPDRAAHCWEDRESNLYGFIEFAAKRQLTSIASLYCEMLVPLSQTESAASSTCQFLQQDRHHGSSRQDHQLMSWTIIFSELKYYINKVHGRATKTSLTLAGGAMAPTRESSELEDEVAVMLQSYLRLIGNVAKYSAEGRLTLITDTEYAAVDTIWLYCCKAMPGRLRACAFNALEALCQNKGDQDQELFWQSLGFWLAEGGNVLPKALRATGPTLSPTAAEEVAFSQTASGFEEASAFLSFLQALIAPLQSTSTLQDQLPFPESYISTAPDQGIDHFVDFALDRVFVKLADELTDDTEKQLLRLTCYNFVSLCVRSFNDHLLLLAENPLDSIDSLIAARSLDQYVALHPFHRVMDWLFNDQVLRALFMASHEDPDLISRSSSSSPAVLSLTHCIDTMHLVLDNQKAYMTQVKRSVDRSGIKPRYVSEANRTLTTFEESVLSHPQLVIDLGLYCASGHEELTLTALSLMTKLTSSSTLHSSRSYGPRKLRGIDQVTEQLQSEGSLPMTAQSLIFQLQATAGLPLAESQAFPALLRQAILGLLESGLDVKEDRPNFTHLLLGFEFDQGKLIFNEDVAAGGSSLFREVMGTAIQTSAFDVNVGPEAEQLLICKMAWRILRRLWSSPLCTSIILAELQTAEFWAACAANATLVNQATSWAGVQLHNPEFLVMPSAECLRNFLLYRTMLFDYFSTEIRFLRVSGSLTDLNKAKAALLGTCTPLGAPPFKCITALDMFDFMSLTLPEQLYPPRSNFINLDDLSTCKDLKDGTRRLYDVGLVRDFLELRGRQIFASGVDPASPQGAQVSTELSAFEAYCVANNAALQIQEARLEALLSWQHLITSMLDLLQFSPPAKSSFILKIVHLTLPILEKLSAAAANEDHQAEAIIVSRLTRKVISHFDFKALSSRSNGNSSSSAVAISGDLATHRLSKLFATCVQGISDPSSEVALRETLYTISHIYLKGIVDLGDGGIHQQSEAIRVIKSSGSRVIDSLCDDANVGVAAVRMPALLLLQDLIFLSHVRELRFFVAGLTRLGFPAILVDGMRTVVEEARTLPVQGLAFFFTQHFAKLDILLLLAQTVSGSDILLSAGLFDAIRVSGLFTLDPDLGIDFDDPLALKQYYRLLLSTIRVLNAVLVSKGYENEVVAGVARRFLGDCRMLILNVFKKHAKIGNLTNGSTTEDKLTGEIEELITELVDAFVLLMVLAGYVETEPNGGSPGNGEVRQVRKHFS